MYLSNTTSLQPFIFLVGSKPLRKLKWDKCMTQICSLVKMYPIPKGHRKGERSSYKPCAQTLSRGKSNQQTGPEVPGHKARSAPYSWLLLLLSWTPTSRPTTSWREPQPWAAQPKPSPNPLGSALQCDKVQASHVEIPHLHCQRAALGNVCKKKYTP